VIRLHAVEAAPAGASAAAKPVLGPLDFAVERGERHLILGANGSGKTTLMKLLAGLVPARAGRAEGAWAAEPRWPAVAAMFETPDSQFLGETVAADVAFGLEGLGLSDSELRGRVSAALDSFELAPFTERDPRSLSAGEKARALLAAAWAAKPSLLLLDQTLAHLDPGFRRALEARLAAAAASGEFALVRTHQEAEAPLDGEQLHLLEGGRWVVAATGDSRVTNVPVPLGVRVTEALAARGRSGSAPLLGPGGPRIAPWRPVAGASGERAFALQDVTWGPPAAAPLFERFSIEGARGATLALIGASGSGKSSLLKLVAGLEKPLAGTAWRAGGPGPRGWAMALEYPERQLIGRSVIEDVAMALWVEGVPRLERERRARAALQSVGLEPERFEGRLPATLSEGEKRRAAIAGLLANPADMLLLDEPTAGLDPEGRRALREALDLLRAAGTTILLASHDLDFVHAVADRVVMLARPEGRPATVVADDVPAHVFRDAAALAAARLPAPDVVVFEDSLRASGVIGADVGGARDADGLVAHLGQEALPGQRPRPADHVETGAA